MATSELAREQLAVAVKAASDKGGFDQVALDVSGPLPLTEIFLIVSGRNERNVNAIAGEIEDQLIASGVKPLRREGKSEGRWVLLDFGDVIVHVFHEEERMYYGLERLWNDCPILPISVDVAVPGSAD